MSGEDIWFVLFLIASAAAIGIPLGLSDRKSGRN